VGVSAEGDGGSPAVVIAEMTGDRDPGYGWTSRAAVEAGICLAKQVRIPRCRHLGQRFDSQIAIEFASRLQAGEI